MSKFSAKKRRPIKDMRKAHWLTRLQSEATHQKAVIESTAITSSIEFFSSRGLLTLRYPLTTKAVSSPMGLGSDSTPVAVKIAGRRVFLSDSTQFLLEYTCRLSRKGAFCVLPSFRGETPDATHLSQFYHAEAEIIGGFEDAIELAEDYVRYLAQALLKSSRTALVSILEDISHIERVASRTGSWPRVALSDAVKELLPSDVSTDSRHGYRTISRHGERELIDRYGGFVWLTGLDALAVPFYQATTPGNDNVALAADLLAGVGELIGLGERHGTGAEVTRALRRHQMKFKGSYEWYCRLKNMQPLRTAGFGMGLDRFLAWVFQHRDIRQTVLFPRLFANVADYP